MHAIHFFACPTYGFFSTLKLVITTGRSIRIENTLFFVRWQYTMRRAFHTIKLLGD